MDSKSVLRELQAAGWYIDRQTGSHVQLKHPTKPGLVTVAHPTKDIPPGTLASIRRQSGLKLR